MPNTLMTFNPADITADVIMVADRDGDVYDRLPNTNGGWRRRQPDRNGGIFSLATIIYVYGPVTAIELCVGDVDDCPHDHDHEVARVATRPSLSNGGDGR